jgi:pseudouridine-5'-phosphate glycosidase
LRRLGAPGQQTRRTAKRTSSPTEASPGTCDIIEDVSLRIAPAIQDAISAGKPVVALESTVITHGLPKPRNLETAWALERTVRLGGAVPATVALVGGELVVGAGATELERLAGGAAEKASLWNLGVLAAQGSDAGTTVAATLHAAHRAGIQVFATGGIGGVHPQPFDESADLTALARYPVLTVSAGPKSILLAGATLERLETLGVAVVGYRSTRLAGFHVAQTEHPLPAGCDSPEEIARAFRSHLSLGLAGGMLVSNPVSKGLESGELARYRTSAEHDADAAGVTGRDRTPFLLARLAEISAESTAESTVETNMRLLHENAALAARIAVALQLPLTEGVPR